MGDFHDQRVAQVEAARDDGHAGTARLGLGFAGEQRFVHVAVAFQDPAVDGEGGAGRDRDAVAGLQAAARDALDAAVGVQAVGGLGKSRQAVAQTGRSAFTGARFQPTGHQQQADDHRDRIEIDLVSLVESHHAGDDGDGDAQCHRGVHADAALSGVTPGRREEGAGRKEQCRDREHGLGPDHQLLQVGRDGVATDIAGHGEHHHLHHAEDAHQHAPECPAAGARIGAFDHVQRQGARLVADVGHAGEQGAEGVPGGIPFQSGAARDHVDLDAGVLVIDGGGDGLGAGGAVHRVHGQDGFLARRVAGQRPGVLHQLFRVVQNGKAAGIHHHGECFVFGRLWGVGDIRQWRWPAGSRWGRGRANQQADSVKFCSIMVSGSELRGARLSRSPADVAACSDMPAPAVASGHRLSGRYAVILGRKLRHDHHSPCHQDRCHAWPGIQLARDAGPFVQGWGQRRPGQLLARLGRAAYRNGPAGPRGGGGPGYRCRRAG